MGIHRARLMRGLVIAQDHDLGIGLISWWW